MLDDIKAAVLKSNEIEKVILPEIGIDIYLRHMTGGERDQFMTTATKAQEDKNYLGLDRLLVALCLCDEKGTLLFKSGDELKDVDATLITTLKDKAIEMNALSKKASEAVAKNS